jgi:hypothetical protein
VLLRYIYEASVQKITPLWSGPGPLLANVQRFFYNFCQNVIGFHSHTRGQSRLGTFWFVQAVGRELGIGGLHEYTELKSVNYSGFSIAEAKENSNHG